MKASWCLLAAVPLLASAAPSPQGPPAQAPPAPAPPAANPPADVVGANACAQVAPATSSILAANPSATPTVAASVAIACLQSVPNKPEEARRLVTSVKAFAQWQSTLAWLKDPPASYMLPATDILGGLDEIAARVEAGGFASEYDFQAAIFSLMLSAHDGHFFYRGDAFKGFSFRNRLGEDVVSASVDGVQVPKLFHLSDLQAAGNGTGSFTPSAITMINGEDAMAVIVRKNLELSVYQDPDSQWNSNFKAYMSPNTVPIFTSSLLYQGETLTLTYENGTTRTENWFAIVRPGIDFTGINNGEDYYNRLCNPATPTAPLTAPFPTIPPLQAYPEPVVRDEVGNATTGYFLSGEGYDDVAVLSVLTFFQESAGPLAFLSDFQKTVENFLNECREAGKTRLVLDFTRNGGGLVLAGYELFAQLFPEVDRFEAQNLRLADSVAGIARIINDLQLDDEDGALDPSQEAALATVRSNAIVGSLVPGLVVTPEGQNLTVDQLLTPVELKGDDFTQYMKVNGNDTPDPQFNLTGVGSRSNPPPAVFRPENVVILTDGTCASTCTLVAYLLIYQRNVQATVLGGRPQTGPMQSVAGVEGGQVFNFPLISNISGAALQLAPEDQKAALQAGDVGILAEGYAIQRGFTPSAHGSVNGKNNFMADDAQTPLQFLYQAANCRTFYTAEMLMDPVKTWQRAVDATWTSPESFCVEGSRVPLNTSRGTDPFFRLSADAAMGAAPGGRAATSESLRWGALVAALVVLFTF